MNVDDDIAHGMAPAEVEPLSAQGELGFWEYDWHSSKFLASSATSRILGLPDATPTVLAMVCDQLGSNASALSRAIDITRTEGKSFALVCELSTAAGHRKRVQIRGQLAGRPGASDSRVVGMVQDLSERRLLDRIAQESELTLNQIEQITHIGHWSVSLTDGSIYHSDEIKRIFGYEPSEYALSVEEAINAYHPDDREAVTQHFARAAETGEAYEFDLRVIQPSGNVRFVHSKGYTEQDEFGKVIRVYGVFQDITDRVLAERALKESEASMKALLDAVQTAIIVHGSDGEIILSNQMANRLLAPLTKSVVGKVLSDPAWRFIAEDGSPLPVEALPVSRILKSRQPIRNLVLGMLDAGEVTWLLINGVPVVDKDGELSKVIVSFVDITERKEMEARLHQSDKMRAIGQLAGGVAHDFNNQLLVMLNYGELLKETLPVDSTESGWVSEMLKGVSRSTELTKQLLAFARKGKYMVKIVDINSLISDVMSMATHSFDKRIKLTHRANAARATIQGDPSQLQNALLNMALNARDAMPAGGELEFSTDRVILDEESLNQKGLPPGSADCVRITIRDTGIGMDADTREQVFEPFFTTKPQGQGTGMGMASVYGTVKNHHGSIELVSKPGVGTTLTLHFPFAEGQNDETDRPGMVAAKARGNILIIDDEEGAAVSMREILERRGYAATTCCGGRQALKHFERTWQTTDLVLLDLIMPEMSGTEVFYALRAIDPNVKVLLISGYSFTDEAKRVVEDGAMGFVVKPVPVQKLLQTIAAITAGAS